MVKKCPRSRTIEEGFIPFHQCDAEQSDPQIIEEAYDTGIYRDEPTLYCPIRTLKDMEAFQHRSEAEAGKLFNLDSLLTEAEDFARKIRDRHEDREGVPRLPPKEDPVVANGKRQAHYAKYLLSQIEITREAMKQGNAQKAATHAYWVGRYYEALRVCQVEHIAARERTQMAARKRGGEGQATPSHVASSWKARAETLRQEKKLLVEKSVNPLSPRPSSKSRAESGKRSERKFRRAVNFLGKPHQRPRTSHYSTSR